MDLFETYEDLFVDDLKKTHKDCGCHKKPHKDCGCHKKHHHCDDCDCHNNSCVCALLRKTCQGTKIRIVTDSGDVIEGKFLGLNGENGCATINVPEMMSPFHPSEIVFVDCNKIESVSFVD